MLMSRASCQMVINSSDEIWSSTNDMYKLETCSTWNRPNFHIPSHQRHILDFESVKFDHRKGESYDICKYFVMTDIIVDTYEAV